MYQIKSGAGRKHLPQRNNPKPAEKKPKKVIPSWLGVVRHIEKMHGKEMQNEREKRGSQVKPKI
jgi:predicted metal-dependent phosphoesterase TrpH